MFICKTYGRLARLSRPIAGGGMRPLLVCLWALMLASGCGSARLLGNSGWVADYDSAEKECRRSGGDMLIFYVDSRISRNRTVEAALKDPAVKELIADCVRCRLFKDYEPDRRYVGQYGVERAPALILVLADGTYHAHTGPMSGEDIRAFLTGADAPGQEPVLDPHIPRLARYDWVDNLESAEATAGQTGQPILVVLCRTFSWDLPTMMNLLERPEVWRRFSDFVHCRPGLLHKADGNQFGVTAWPALVILYPDGSHRVLERPSLPEEIVRFASSNPSRGLNARAETPRGR